VLVIRPLINTAAILLCLSRKKTHADGRVQTFKRAKKHKSYAVHATNATRFILYQTACRWKYFSTPLLFGQ
jgi:hypothetical protein